MSKFQVDWVIKHAEDRHYPGYKQIRSKSVQKSFNKFNQSSLYLTQVPIEVLLYLIKKCQLVIKRSFNQNCFQAEQVVLKIQYHHRGKFNIQIPKTMKKINFLKQFQKVKFIIPSILIQSIKVLFIQLQIIIKENSIKKDNLKNNDNLYKDFVVDSNQIFRKNSNDEDLEQQVEEQFLRIVKDVRHEGVIEKKNIRQIRNKLQQTLAGQTKLFSKKFYQQFQKDCLYFETKKIPDNLQHSLLDQLQNLRLPMKKFPMRGKSGFMNLLSTAITNKNKVLSNKYHLTNEVKLEKRHILERKTPNLMKQELTTLATAYSKFTTMRLNFSLDEETKNKFFEKS